MSVPVAEPAADKVLTVVYDGECPFCRNYVRLTALRSAVGSVDLVDARGRGTEVRRLESLGYDLDEGMAAIYGGKVYHGSDAVVMISSLTGENGTAARWLALLLRDPTRARWLYPAMKLGRNLTLKMLGKKPIR